MSENENWDSLGIQAEFANLNRSVVDAVKGHPQVRHDANNGAIEYSLTANGLVYEVFRALPWGSMVRITERRINPVEQSVMTPQGAKVSIDFTSAETVYRVYPDGKWELNSDSRSELLSERTSVTRRIPLEQQKILQVFGLNPMDDAYMRAGIMRTRAIAKQITGGNG